MEQSTMKFLTPQDNIKLFPTGFTITLKGELTEILRAIGHENEVIEAEDELGKFSFCVLQFEEGVYVILQHYPWTKFSQPDGVTSVLYERDKGILPSIIVQHLKHFFPQVEFDVIPPDDMTIEQFSKK